MTTVTPQSAPARLFDFERWTAQLPELSARYQAGHPFPHIHLADFLEPAVLRSVIDAFPSPTATSWIQYKHFNENKLGKSKREEFPEAIGAVIDELLSPEFVDWIAKLTGIPELMADPRLDGGGMHQTESGGFLNIHTDFTRHHYHLNWRRRCNLIVYLNEDWRPEWGGDLELWDAAMTQRVAKYPPLANHAVVFNTDEKSFHGYPDPINCPVDRSRRSLALYYYTLEEGAPRVPRATQYRARPQDGLRRVGIWVDGKLISLYTGLKTRLHISDDLVSRVLGSLSRKKPK